MILSHFCLRAYPKDGCTRPCNISMCPSFHTLISSLICFLSSLILSCLVQYNSHYLVCLWLCRRAAVLPQLFPQDVRLLVSIALSSRTAFVLLTLILLHTPPSSSPPYCPFEGSFGPAAPSAAGAGDVYIAVERWAT